jgi:threonine dehydratase
MSPQSSRPVFSIPPDYVQTPYFQGAALSDLIGGVVMLKDETVSPVRSFKGRGAFHLCNQLLGEGLKLVCASAGNFGQGMAVAGAARGHSVTVFVSSSANPLKVRRMRELGAEVVSAGRDFDEAKHEARLFARRCGAVFVEDGAEDSITEGASSIGFEMLDSTPELDTVCIPLGNGALLCGIARALRSAPKPVRVIAVTALGAPAMRESLIHRRLIEAPAHTIADGIAVRSPVPEIMEELSRVVDLTLEVTDADIECAMRFVYEHHTIVTEPAGVVGVAAILKFPDLFRGSCVATILCGGNVAPEEYQRIFCVEGVHGSSRDS